MCRNTMYLKHLLLLLAVLVHDATCDREVVHDTRISNTTIGGIFARDAFMRNSFSLAVRTINACVYNRAVCDAMHRCEPGVDCNRFHRAHFAANIYEVNNDPFDVYEEIEQLSSASPMGISVLFGPHHGLSSHFIQEICELHDLPNIVIRREIEHDRLRSINLYPDTETLAYIYVKMLLAYNWTEFSVIYDTTERFITLDNVLKLREIVNITVVQSYRLDFGTSYTKSLLAAKASKHTQFLIDCSHEILSEVLKQTQRVGMMTEKYHYIITSFDLQTIDLSPYIYSGVTISGMRLIDPHDNFTREFVGAHLDDFNITSVEKLTTHEALMFDAVALFTLAYKDLTYEYDIKDLSLNQQDYMSKWDKGPEVRSTPPTLWYYGLSLRNYLLHTSFNGLTGPVAIDSDGARRRFKIDILDLDENGLTKIGFWNQGEGFNQERVSSKLIKKHLNVLITLNAPYAKKTELSQGVEGNDRYEGFVIDIIKHLSKRLGFTYTFHVQENAQNGQCSVEKATNSCVCTDMMEKVLNGKVDLAITDLTITKERQQCVDFSTPFMNMGIAILYKKPTNAAPTLFTFLTPFRNNVWAYLGGTWCFVSVLFYAVGRLCPDEWTNPYPCVEEPDELHNQFTLGNALWFTMGALMLQGSEIAPIGISTRLLAGSWWFFCLIISSTYTANLAAFLTLENPVTIIRNVSSLYNQTAIKYGAKLNGTTFKFFKESKEDEYRRLARQMEDEDWAAKYMVKENSDGVALVQRENYAFFMESSSIKYVQYRECELQQAGLEIDQKSYAIAFRKDFLYRKQISTGISQLEEDQILGRLREQWWEERGAVCPPKKSGDCETSAEPMNLDQLRGIFVVLGGGLFVSCMLTFCEFLYGIIIISRKEDVKFAETFKEEMRQVSKSRSTKPVLKKQRSSESNLSEVHSTNTIMTTANL